MQSKLKSGRCRPPPFAVKAKVRGTELEILLDNGATARCSLTPYRGLALAPERARKRVRVIPPGIGLRWPDLGYELGIEGLLRICVVTKRRRAKGVRMSSGAHPLKRETRR